MRYSIYNIQYSTHLMKYALKSIINEKRRKFSENSNNTKYAHEMQTNHHTAYKAYFMATTGEKATTAYQHLFITGTTTVVLTQVFTPALLRTHSFVYIFAVHEASKPTSRYFYGRSPPPSNLPLPPFSLPFPAAKRPFLYNNYVIQDPVAGRHTAQRACKVFRTDSTL